MSLIYLCYENGPTEREFFFSHGVQQYALTYWTVLWNDIYDANVFWFALLPRTENLQKVEDYQSEVAHDNWKRLKTYKGRWCDNLSQATYLIWTSFLNSFRRTVFSNFILFFAKMKEENFIVTFLSQRLVDFIWGSWEYPRSTGVSEDHGKDALY
jgi:hypothetical protein